MGEHRKAIAILKDDLARVKARAIELNVDAVLSSVAISTPSVNTNMVLSRDFSSVSSSGSVVRSYSA